MASRDDIPMCQIHKYKNTNTKTQIQKYTPWKQGRLYHSKRHLHSNTKFPKYKYKNTNMKIHTVETGGGSITGDILKYNYNLADTN